MDDKKFESVYSNKVRAGKRRTYFFDVRQTKGEDYYITITESTRRFDGNGYERHKIFLYKEDFNRFLGSLDETINHVKTELMPDFDYEMYERRQQEWEEKMAEENQDEADDASSESGSDEDNSDSEKAEKSISGSGTTSDSNDSDGDDEDISW